MASSVPTDNVLIDNEDALKDAMSEIKSLSKEDLLAVDCEGVNLSRKGKLTILIMASRKKIYVFDIQVLGRPVFDGGIREILEDESREKLMFDCRQDSDCMWHHFNVKLAGVLDVQLLDMIYRGKTTGVEKMNGYLRCIENYTNHRDVVKAKQAGRFLLKMDSKVWSRRPIPESLVEYCCKDVSGLFELYKVLKTCEDDPERLKVASDRYVDVFRGLSERCYNRFDSHPYLPLYIIPEKGTFSFPPSTTQCTKCNRLLPQTAFNSYQRRRGDYICRVCKKIITLDY